MITSRWVTIAIIASLGTFAFIAPYSLAGTAVDAAMKPGVYPVVKRVQFGFTVENTLGKVLKKAKFWTYAPVRQTATQKVTKITASQAYQLSTDELGNQILLFEFEDLPAYAAKEISIRVEIDMAEKPNPWPEKSLGLFLQNEQYIESGNFRVASLANTLTEASISGTAKNLFNWVATNIHSVEYIPDDRGALYALDKKTGDCTEFAYLFTALSRASGIPARAMGGYVMAESGVLKAADYHNWAEFYLDGTWLLADPQKRVFAKDSSHYVAMRIISKNVPNALGNSHRFSFAGDGLKITMR